MSITLVPTVYTIVLEDGSKAENDILLLKLAMQEIEERHNAFDTGYISTPEFLGELAALFDSKGAKGCTPANAFRIWEDLNVSWSEVKKNGSQPSKSPDSMVSTDSTSPPSSDK